MAHSDLRKLILGRCARLRFSGPVHVPSVARRLIIQNQRDMVFQIPLRDGSTLIGASPELLVRKTGEQFSCHPLAGSISRSPDQEENARRSQVLLSSAKDRDEHAIVIAQLRSQLSDLCRDLDIPDSPSLTRTATMWHLSTKVRGIIRDPKMSALDLARLIHPTAALCGAPKDLAFRTIAALEPSGRGLFAGLVGWSDARGDGEWAVTIRSGIIKGAEARLFSGAGIVPGSNPEAEWQEIEAKLGTMRRALGLESVSV
ncbi:MAG: isochorismate synthase [Acetobacteraceae bacterium]